MPTIEFDDQFTVAPAKPVRQPHDIVSILRNVADLEIALRKQTDRAEAAESELEAVRDDNHRMMLEIDGMRKELAATAPAVPAVHEIAAQLLIAETEMLNAKAWAVGKQSRVHIGFAMTAIGCARALLQSAAVKDSLTAAPDCLACANRGLVNGLSQESYCDGCVYQGRSWRKNHFVLAVKRRCEACAILPCSCK
jgi:metal-sulfur cluster biosynthetic enzyme